MQSHAEFVDNLPTAVSVLINACCFLSSSDKKMAFGNMECRVGGYCLIRLNATVFITVSHMLAAWGTLVRQPLDHNFCFGHNTKVPYTQNCG